MDDFLEMEKLAYQSSDTNGAVSSADIPNNARPVTTKVDNSVHVTTSPDSQLKEHNETSVLGVSKSCNELADSLSQTHDFVLFLGKEAKAIQGTTPDGSGINEKLDDFSATYVEVG